MTMSRNAVGNLIARYKKVLHNCSLMNSFGSLAATVVLSGAVVLGGASGAMAVDTVVVGNGVATTVEDETTVLDVIGGGYATSNNIANVEGQTSLAIIDSASSSYVYGGGWASGTGATANVDSTDVVFSSSGSVVLIFGGGYANNSGTAGVTTSTKMQISDGSITYAFGGGYAIGDSVTADVGSSGESDSTTIEITGGTIKGGVFGGGYTGGESSTATIYGDTNIYISGGTFSSGTGASGLKSVSSQGIYGGGYAEGSDSAANVTGTASVIITDGEFSNVSIFGGGLAVASSSTATVDATEVEISNVTIDGSVYGGGQSLGTDADADVGSASVTIDNATITGSVYGGGYASSGFANVDETSITITDTVIEGDIYIGGYYNNYSNDTYSYYSTTTTGELYFNSGTVNDIYGGNYVGLLCEDHTSVLESYIKVSGGTIENIYGGGYGYSNYSGVEDVEVVIDGGTIGNIYAGGSGKYTWVDTAYITINSGTVDNIYGGGYANFAAYYTKVYAYIDTASTIELTGGTVTGNIYGGGYAAEGYSSTYYTTSEVAASIINITGGTVQGNIYGGGYAEAYGVSTVESSEITISGGTVEGSIFLGGYALTDGEATVTTGTITITGGTINGIVDGSGADSSTLEIGSDTTGYTGTLTGIQDFDIVNIYAGSNITIGATDNLGTVNFRSGSTLSMDVENASLNASTINVSSGAILDLSATSGTVTINNVAFDSVSSEASAWGYVGDESSAENYDSETLLTSAYLTVSEFSYDSGVYSVTLGADSSAITEALGDSASAAAADFAADAMTSSNETFVEAMTKVLEGDNSGEVIESMSQGSTVTGVVSGISAASGATVTNTSARTTMAPKAKTEIRGETSSWLAMNGDGAILPAADGGKMVQGFGIWAMPMFSHTSADGFSSGEGSYGYDTDIFGVTLGADYTFASDLRLGVAFSVGQGSSTSTGTANAENDFHYYGISVYGAKHFDQFGLSFDMGYTVSENDTVQEVGGTNFYADIDAAMFTVGLKAEYLVPLDGFNVTPYAGVRFNYYDVDSYDTTAGGAFAYENESSDSVLWEFPVGVVLDTTTQVGSWDFTPSLALGVKFAAGDLDAEQYVKIGDADPLPFSSEVADEITFQGGIGLGFAKDVCNISLNYTLDLSENVESHGVSVNLRYDF